MGTASRSAEWCSLALKYGGKDGKSFQLDLNHTSGVTNLTECANDSADLRSITVSEATLNQLRNHTILVVDSKSSGSAVAKTTYSFYHSVLKTIFQEYDIPHKHLETESSTSIQEFANLVAPNPEKRYLVLFFSGDTTIFEFVNFVNTNISDSTLQPHITLLPFAHGTGNALANSIGLFNDVMATYALFNFNVQHLPVHELFSSTPLKPVNSAHAPLTGNKSILFLVVASWCLHSTLVYESDKPELRSKYGSERFRIAATKILEENPVFKARLTLKGENKSFIYDNGWKSEVGDSNFQDLSYFILAAVSNFEKSFKISPSSSINADELHLVTFPHVSSETTMRLMNEAYDNGKHINDPLVLYKKVTANQSFELNISDDMNPALSIICIDGSSWSVTGTGRQITAKTSLNSFLHYLSL